MIMGPELTKKRLDYLTGLGLILLYIRLRLAKWIDLEEMY